MTPPRPGDREEPPAPSDCPLCLRPWPGLDPAGAIEAVGGLLLGLIALYSPYVHFTLAGHRLPIPQPWGIPCIIASVATVFIDAQLATRARDRGAVEANRERDHASEERQRADRERNRADRERNRAAEARKRQAESFERLDQAALLSARVQLHPSPANRERLRIFFTLMAQQLLNGSEVESEGEGEV